METNLFLSMFIKPRLIAVHVSEDSYVVLPNQKFLVMLLDFIEKDVEAMNRCEGKSFTEYPLLQSQGIVSGLEGILKSHPECVNEIGVFRAILKLVFRLYRTTLTVVADSQINEKEEDESRELLSKGPIQAIPEDLTIITETDHIAKNKLDCRGHIIGFYSPSQTLHLKRLMLSCWLTCKHSSLTISQMVALLPDTGFESNQSHNTNCLNDLEDTGSFLSSSDPFQLESRGDSASPCHLFNNDVVCLLWDLLGSVLTIKHIGGIIFVAEAITRIVHRLTALITVNNFVSSLPGSFTHILLDDRNINNRNFILRRSTGYSKAICSVSVMIINNH